MKDQFLVSPAVLRFLRVWIWIDIIIVFTISFLDIVGWLFDIQLLTNFGSNWTPMQPVTAVCFLLCALALLFIPNDHIGKTLNIIPKLSGLAVGMAGLLTIMTYAGVFISGKGITTIPFIEMFLSPGSRMALVTALNFLFIGIIIILQTYRTRRAVSLAHMLIILPLVLSYLVLLSYFLGVYHIHEIQAIPVALNTGIAFFFLCSALLCLHPESWLMKTFAGLYTGSEMARKLLPGLILFPVLIG